MSSKEFDYVNEQMRDIERFLSSTINEHYRKDVLNAIRLQLLEAYREGYHDCKKTIFD